MSVAFIPTRRKELWSWYINDWANSSWPNVGNAFCVPLLLTALCIQKACQDIVCDITGHAIEHDKAAKVYIGNIPIVPESFAFYMISISGMFQAIIFCGIGPIADYGSYRKILFTASTISGAIGVCLYFLFWDATKIWWLAGILTIILNIVYGLSTIAYNAYLPLLVSSHPKIINAVTKGVNDEELDDMEQKLANEISQIGFGIGYVGTIISVIITVIILIIYPSFNYYIDETSYGYTEKSNLNSQHTHFHQFNELFGQTVNEIDVFHTSNQIISMQFKYQNMKYNSFAANHGEYENANIIQSIYNDTNQISSIKVWTSSETSSIAAIQFSDGWIASDIIGDSISLSSHQQSVASYTSANTKWILGGWYGIIASDSSTNDNQSFLSSISFLWINPKSDSLWDTQGYRLSLLVSGIWWLLFGLFPVFNLKQRPGPTLPPQQKWYLFGFKQVGSTIKDAKENKEIFWYLIAWFLFSDGMNTFSSAAVIFASIEFGFGGSQYGILMLLTLSFALIGNFLFLWIEKKFNIRQKSMLLFHLFVMAALPIFVGIGLIPSLPFGVKTELEFYICVAIFGINVGSMQSYARSVFAMLVPQGRETEMFALYEITDKGSSWMGTLMIAIISNVASLRWGIFYVFFFFAVPIPILYFKVKVTINKDQEAKDGKLAMPRKVKFGFQRSKTLVNQRNEFKDTLRRSLTYQF